MKYTSKKITNTVKNAAHDLVVRRQNANYERFMQGKANVFQATETKAQALFWAMN